MIADSGVWKNYPKGNDDNTHFCVEGAKEMSKLATGLIQDAKMDIAKDLKKE